MCGDIFPFHAVIVLPFLLNSNLRVLFRNALFCVRFLEIRCHFAAMILQWNVWSAQLKRLKCGCKCDRPLRSACQRKASEWYLPVSPMPRLSGLTRFLGRCISLPAQSFIRLHPPEIDSSWSFTLHSFIVGAIYFPPFAQSLMRALPSSQISSFPLFLLCVFSIYRWTLLFSTAWGWNVATFCMRCCFSLFSHFCSAFPFYCFPRYVISHTIHSRRANGMDARQCGMWRDEREVTQGVREPEDKAAWGWPLSAWVLDPFPLATRSDGLFFSSPGQAIFQEHAVRRDKRLSAMKFALPRLRNEWNEWGNGQWGNDASSTRIWRYPSRANRSANLISPVQHAILETD